MRLIEHPDREALTLALAQDIADALGMALNTRDRAVLCLPGGSTPVPAFKALAAARLDWARVSVVPGDERWVPADHPRSNARLIRRNLIDEGASAAELVELWDSALDPEAGAAAAAARVGALLPLSVLLLGMGEDMHIASLFPDNDGTAAALDAGAPPVVAIRSEALAEARLTLSGPALKTAMDPHLMIFGAAKRAALERAAKLPPAQAPVRALWGDLNVHWAE